MLIAISVAAAVTASSFAPGAAAPVNPAQPPIVVHITAAPNVPSSLVTMAIAETDAIFLSAGVSFVWRRGESSLTSLRVEIGNDQGAAAHDVTPLGWITFEDGRPDQQIYLSYANAAQFMADSRAIVGLVNHMPRGEREMLLARAMGRALAHEIGHYLLATKAHTPRGLLKAVRSARELFAADRKRFDLEPAQRLQIAARLQGDPVIASRPAPVGGPPWPGTSR